MNPSSGIRFNLAGLGFDLHSQSGTSSRLPRSFESFVAPPSPSGETAASYIVDTAAADRLRVPEPGHLLWDCATWRMGPCDEGSLSLQICNVLENRWMTVVNVARDFASGTICPLARSHGGPSQFAFSYPVDQVLAINRLLHFDAGLLHAAGMKMNGQGYLFFGASGVGKTTTARLWRSRGATLLCDEKVIVRPDGRGFRLYGSPWHGEEPEVNAQDAPLKAIFHLRQATFNRATPMAPVEAVSFILANAIAPFYSEEGIARMLALWDRVTQNVPVYQLDFTPDPRAIETCLGAA